MGTPLGPKYIPYTYMDPLGFRELGSLEELCAVPNHDQGAPDNSVRNRV